MSETQASCAIPIQSARRAGAAPALFVYTPSTEPCGIETFTRTMLGVLKAREPGPNYEALPLTGRWREWPHLLNEVWYSRKIIFNLPLVAWKRRLFAPVLLLIAAKLLRRRVTVVMHEWKALHPLRRLALLPFVWLCDDLVVLSPYVGEQIIAAPLARAARSKCRVLPHPPTVARPDTLRVTERVREVERARRDHDIVIGSFGSIYKGKASAALLHVAEHLHDCGVRALVVLVGGFIRSLDDYEKTFRAQLSGSALDKHVIVTGLVAEEAEIYALFEQIDVFLFQFPEGLTARRSSVIACLQSQRPVVVSSPPSSTEFAHHPGFANAVASGALSLVDRSASIAEISDRVLAAVRKPAANTSLDGEAWWKATIESARAIF
jgi:glycosyltransferase involved in cell wall biosynthesis